MRRTLVPSLAVLALLALPVHAVQPARSAPLVPSLIDAPEGSTLYDQTDNPGSSSSTSQNFEAGFEAYDNAAADDFVVPDGFSWSVTGVYAPGVYFNGAGPLVSVDVTFYADAAGLPGASECTAAGVAPADSAGTLTIALPGPCDLGAGKHWVSVVANMDFATGGQWGWTERVPQSFDPAAWQNPGNGFGTGCTSWSGRLGCGVGFDIDHVYALAGTASAATVTQEIPTLGSWGVALLVLLLAAGSVWLLARRRAA